MPASVKPLSALVGADAANCILALIDILSSSRHRIEARNGELFITRAQPDADAEEEAWHG
jgi:hypothetical protein